MEGGHKEFDISWRKLGLYAPAIVQFCIAALKVLKLTNSIPSCTGTVSVSSVVFEAVVYVAVVFGVVDVNGGTFGLQP